MSSVIIAFDPSLSSTGVCVLPTDSNTPIAYESINPIVGDPNRLSYIYSRFKAILASYDDIAFVAFEKQIPQMRYGYSAGSILPLAENIGVLKLAISNVAIARNPKVSVLAIPPKDIKIFATSNGSAKKEDMIAAVNGHHIKSIRSSILEYAVNDVVDAYHLARLVKHLADKGEYQQYVYRKGEETVCQL